MSLSEDRIPLTVPFIDKDDIMKVTEVLQSGNLSTGAQVEELERELAEYVNCKHVVCLTSATAGLHLALIVAGIQPGDEVIVPSFTFPATVQVPSLLGAKPIMVDCEYNTYTINPAEVEKAISDKTKVIMPVSPFGLPYDLEAIRSIADRHGLKVIGDNACSLGAKFWGTKLGAAECDLYNKDKTLQLDGAGHGMRGKAEDMSVFSFHPTKIMTAGEGGCVCTENSDWATQMRMLRNHGAIHRDDPEPKMRFVTIGYNYRMNDINAALARVQLSKLDMMILQRRQAAGLYTELLEQLNPAPRVGRFGGAGEIPLPDKRYNIVTPYEAEGFFHTYQRYVVYLTYHDGLPVRNELRKRGIQTSFGFYDVTDEPFVERLGLYKRCPITRNLMRNTVSLPLYHTIKRDQQERVVDTLKAILKL